MLSTCPLVCPSVRLFLRLLIIIIIIIIIPWQCLWCCHHGRGIAKVHPVHLMNVERRQSKTKPNDLGCEPACTGCQSLHPPSPFIIITKRESWYLFYRPTEGRWLSRRSWLVTYRDGLPVHRWSPILVLTGSDVAQLRWSTPTRYHLAKPPTIWWVMEWAEFNVPLDTQQVMSEASLSK